MELKNKIIVITGGTSGIGKEIVKQLCRENKLIVIAHRENLVDEMKKIDEKISAYRCDLASSKDVEDTADQIHKMFPSIDVLINNAAIQHNQKFLDDDFSYESIEREIHVNLTVVCKLTYLLLPSLLKKTNSLIMNVNSGLALAPKTNSAVYCATKAALNTFSLSLGYQLESTNIKVLQVFMPLVDTPMTAGRGRGKISPESAARKLIEGLRQERLITDVGKTRMLRILLRIFPLLAYRIMKRG